MPMPQIPEVRELMQAGVHFGHASGKWHPKMKPYIFATRDKLHIIDLEKTQKILGEVLPILEQRVKDGKLVVIVGTKKQVAPRVKELGEKLGVPYVSERWLGGTMTNWTEMQQSISKMKKMETFLESEDVSSMIKKERVAMQNDLRRMQTKFGGIRDMVRKPDVMFVIDPSHEHNAIKEALHQKIEIFGLVDTNSNPTPINHVIPTNDDGPKAIKLMMDLVEATIASGLEARGAAAAEPKATKEDKEVTVEAKTEEA
jgi:small subunit ribosomal protein S2